ncbi:MAG TPA: acyl-CoA thioesterase [Gaiellales bacterium]|nr:acyl-CoA thioesterase [Gaiellales bacterium]
MPHTPAHVKSVEIRWRDMDGFNHVNNSSYLTYLEEARDELLTGLLGAETTHRIVLRRVELDFLSGLTQSDDRAQVELRVVGIGSSSVTTEELIRAASDGRVAARARAVTVYTNDARDAAEPLPGPVRELLMPLLEQPAP